MNVLLAGGTGYVGRALRKRLLEQEHQVRLLVRNTSPETADFETVVGSALDWNACLKAADGCDAVINLVGIIREYPRRGITFDSLHTGVTASLVKAARFTGVGRFLQMSALGTKNGAASRYHRTKFTAEQIVRGSGMYWTIFRPSVIFHPGDNFTKELAALVRRPVVPFIDGGKALLQPVSLENVVGPMADSLERGDTHGEVYEIGGPERISFGELVQEIAAYYKIPLRKMKISSALMRPVVRIMQRFESFPLTADQLVMLTRDNVCDTARFQAAFNITELDPFRAALPSLLDAAALHSHH